MRCRFCGSTSLHEDRQHKNFSTGKAIAGAVTFGVVGAAAGLIGKDQKGYRCGACGSFMEATMDTFTELSIDSAIRDAESGRSLSMFEYYKKQYPNIQANLPVQTSVTVNTQEDTSLRLVQNADEESETKIKRSYRYGLWQPDCPIYVEGVIIKTSPTGDRLSLVAWNASNKPIRSAYFQVKVLDDTGDVVSECQCVYQGLSVQPGLDGKLPESKEFDLKTELAYKVDLLCEKVAFEGDEVWRNDVGTKPFEIPVQPVINSSNFPRFKYITTKYKDMKKADSLFMPLKENGYWLCDCGQPVLATSSCPRCGDTWENLESTISQKTLQKRQEKVVKERAAKRAEEFVPFIESAQSAHDKKEYELKESRYSEAVKLQLDGSVESLRSAAKLFALIPSYRDADERCAASINLADQREQEAKEAEEKAREEKRLAEEARRRKNKRIASVVIPILIIALIAFVIIYIQMIVPQQTAAKAAAAAEEEYNRKYNFATAEIGDTRFFGSYEQDGDSKNGGEEIEWVVLKKDENKAFLMSLYGLDKQAYEPDTEDSSKIDASWSKNPALRKWLNNTFYNNAFNDDEKKRIITSTYGDVTEKVSLPRAGGISADFKKCLPTTGLYNRGVATDDGKYCWYWERTDSWIAVRVAYAIDSSGSEIKTWAYTDNLAVRPVIWVSF